ncbi:ribosome biogenesis protein MAK21 [Cryptococcus deuterogattii R265]|uniref:Ribosome biogenesis protein MAK21 n=1 Tax=Cryptococcus deuterogattii (strain R265) TaxID=294750 RepID=A0A095EHQ0_CRYD2|nr:ribosome biogenesis protein MAK21 [Cryptococcus deuterogattii R265]KIR71664.1 ribosome biogenesis protein MAK21 [Cryptococcus deuterogattii CA1014]
MPKRGSKSTKLQKGLVNKQPASPEKQPKERKNISDALRQAVIDLGGDEEDLDLIDGVDEDDVAPPQKTAEKPTDEKSLKKELGDFMKGLDFGSVEIAAVESSEEADERSDEEEEDFEGSGEEEEASEVDDEDEEEAEEEDGEESDEEVILKAGVPAKETAPSKPTEETPKSGSTVPKDVDSSSGTNVSASTSWPSLVPPLPSVTSLPNLHPHDLNNLRQKASNLLMNLPPLSRASSSSDQAFISQILQSGTHQDKLSALVLIVRESPVHAVKELDKLRGMAGWKEDGIGGGGNKDQRVAVMKALADWWVGGGGKEQGKLKYFADQPLLAHPQLTDRHLLMYAFEDYLKKWFFNILQVLEVLSHDTLPFVRTQALHIIFRLLAGNAEQEQNLLRLGVNKLGDIDRPVASKASHHILTLLQAHPAMKAVVAREVSTLVLRPSGAVASAAPSTHIKFDDDKGKKATAAAKAEAVGHGRYYGLITLNQMTLTRKDQDVAGRLVDLYFEVFREILGDPNGPEEEEEQAEDSEEVGEDKVQKVAGKVEKWRGRRKGAKPKGGRKTALEEEELVETTKAKLVAAILTGINRALPFAKLDETMFSSYMDTLFKITHAGTFNTSIQALLLIFKVSTTESDSRQAISDRFYRALYDSLFDNRLVTSSKQAMYLNLLFKAMKADDRIQRTMAFVKRLLQMLGMHQPPFICGALYLLGELFSTTPGLKRMLIEPEDDGEEHFVDADADEQERDRSTEKPARVVIGKDYDGRKRDPQYANADSSCLWELTPFLNHFHPSVSLQANQLLHSQTLTGSPDISLNTLISFLDRFVYRNPKKTIQPKGASIMQPAAASDKSGMVVKGEGEAGVMVNSEAFWRKKIEDVPVEMMFFHRYFAEKLKMKEKRGKDKERSTKGSEFGESGSEGDEDEDEEMEDSDEDKSENEKEDEDADSDAAEDDEDSDPEEAEIWKAMKATMPRADDDMGLSEDQDDDISISESSDDHEESDEDEEDEDEAEEVSGEDEEEDEESDEEPAIPDTKGKKRAARSPSPASSASSFPDFDDEDDDVISLSDVDMPNIVLDGKISDVEDEAEIGGKRKKKGEERKERRKKRRELPTFGSYEDYRALIEQAGSEED